MVLAVADKVEDGLGLIQNGAVFLYENGKLVTVGSSSLGLTPLLESESLVFEVNSEEGGSVASHLGASLNWEVNEGWSRRFFSHL